MPNSVPVADLPRSLRINFIPSRYCKRLLTPNVAHGHVAQQHQPEMVYLLLLQFGREGLLAQAKDSEVPNHGSDDT